ncbi:MAG: NAD-dependent epimerase/dehydratase family protein [Patescibacteria group bacterium]|jgi:nucleoside-diphosphate-sugar epimerase
MNNLQKKKILVFGGLGLIGSSTARKCIAEGALVTIADNRAPMYGANDFNMQDLEGKFQLVIGDIRNGDFVNEIVKGQDYIFNFAAQVNHNLSIEDPILDNQINCIGHINVLMACKKNNPEAKLAYPGSRLQYGKIKKLPVNESHPLQPLSVYAIHKNTAEQYYQAFYKHYGIRSVCFRITNPYGPRAQMKSSGYSIINWFIRQALDDKNITIFGEGTQIRDYIYINDLIAGIITAVTNPKTDGQIYNLGSGLATPFKKMAELVIEIAGGGKLKKVPWPKNYDNFETGDFYADITSIKSAIDWMPSTSLRDGVKKTVEYYKQNRKYYW